MVKGNPLDPSNPRRLNRSKFDFTTPEEEAVVNKYWQEQRERYGGKTYVRMN